MVCALVLEFSKETREHSSSSSMTPAGDNHSDGSAPFLRLMVSTPFSKKTLTVPSWVGLRPSGAVSHHYWHVTEMVQML